MSSFEEIPEEFLCPITYELMDDPVICEDGYTYNRSSVNKLRNNRSPFTREIINISRAVPNRILKNIIEKYKTDNNINEKDNNKLNAFEIIKYIVHSLCLLNINNKNTSLNEMYNFVKHNKKYYTKFIQYIKNIFGDKIDKYKIDLLLNIFIVNCSKEFEKIIRETKLIMINILNESS